MQITYGAIALPGTLVGLDRPVDVRLRTAPSGRGGDYSEGGLLDAKRITIQGLIANIVSLAEHDAAIDDLKAKLPYGRFLPLVVESGRTYTAELQRISPTTSATDFALRYEVVFYVPAGVAIADSDTVVSLTTAGGAVNGVPGDENARPSISITVSAIGGTVTVTNTDTGESMSFVPVSTGVRTLNATAERIDTGHTGEWLSGDWVTLKPGNNNILVSTTEDAAVSAVSVAYRARWR